MNCAHTHTTYLGICNCASDSDQLNGSDQTITWYDKDQALAAILLHIPNKGTCTPRISINTKTVCRYAPIHTPPLLQQKHIASMRSPVAPWLL